MPRDASISVMILFSAGELGGAERSLTRMALANEDAGVVYRLATIGGEGAWACWARLQGIDPMVLSCAGRNGFKVGDLLRLIRSVREIQPDVIYAVGVRACMLVRLMRPLLGAVHIVHAIRTSFPQDSDLALRYGRSERALKWLTDGYIANSISGADSLARIARIDRKMIQVIPNGIDVADDGLPPLQTRPKAVAVVANLHRLKSHLPFLDVVQSVALAHPDVVFYLVGRDEMNGAVQRAVSARNLDGVIRFTGFQPDVTRFWAMTRIFVLPSQITEGAPTSILEAQAAGLPAVAYAIGGISELICHGVDGYVIERGNSHDMARAIISLLEDVDGAARMGAAGRRKVEMNFSLERCAQLHAKAWREMCGR